MAKMFNFMCRKRSYTWNSISRAVQYGAFIIFGDGQVLVSAKKTWRLKSQSWSILD